MAKSAKTQAKTTAKKGARAVGGVVAEALGAAAATAAGVVLTRTAEGMSSGARKVGREIAGGEEGCQAGRKACGQEESLCPEEVDKAREKR